LRRLHPFRLLALLALLAIASCAHTPKEAPMQLSPSISADDLLLQPFQGGWGGVPAFDRMVLGDLAPALDAAMASHLAELDAIAANPEPPSFDNTIGAMERSGQAAERAFVYYGIWSTSLSSPEFREVQKALAPRIAAYQSSITQNERLFGRIQDLVGSAEVATLPPAEQRLLKLVHERFAREGATLKGADRERYAAIQARLAELYTRFSNNVLADEEGPVLFLESNQLGGLPASFVASAASAAESRGRKGSYAVTNTRSSMDPFLTFSTERALREQVWRTYIRRADNDDANDNKAIIVEILALRHERSRLMGFENFAAWRLDNRMARTPARADELMKAVWPLAVARVGEEVADMLAVARAEGVDAAFRIEPWDYRFYAEKVRQKRYDLDSDELRNYLQLELLRDAMFMVAKDVFGLGFSPVPAGSVPVYHPDVSVFEVRRVETGEIVGLWYLDPFARQGKRSGAWANCYREHSTIDGGKPILASNNSNFVPGAPGEPVLVSWDDATTLFHEFGHALHYLSSDVAWPSLNSGVRDFVETQSQLLEHWLLTDRVVEGYLRHYKTGAPMPPELVARLKRAETFNQGFSTVEFLASALVDMRLHTIDPTGLDPVAFERETLAALGMPREVVMRHRMPHFSHVFSSEGYAAGYYGYLWADVLTADAAEAFAAAPGGFYDRDLSAKMVKHLFAPRNAVDPGEAWLAFRGREATVDALLRDRGFKQGP
jgi:peptidyl-dipeptidase Dcp